MSIDSFESFYKWNYKDIDMDRYDIDKYDLGVAFAFGRKSAEKELEALREEARITLNRGNEKLAFANQMLKEALEIKEVVSDTSALDVIKYWRWLKGHRERYPHIYERKIKMLTKMAFDKQVMKSYPDDLGCSAKTVKSDIFFLRRFIQRLGS